MTQVSEVAGGQARLISRVAKRARRAAPRAAAQSIAADRSTSSASWAVITGSDLFAYQRDVWERAILFWDTLRQRADNMLAHERAGKPPLLDFDYELILDARRSERPVNYALLRITRYGDKCLEDC